MEKSKRNFRKLIFVIVVLLFMTIYYFAYHRLTLKSISKKIELKTTEYEELLKTSNQAEKEYENYLNINVLEEKEKYFENLKNLEISILEGKSDKKIVYLTFDDGPSPNTLEVLKILKENNILSTFFLVGYPLKEDLYFKIFEDRHTIANHTYSHNISGIYNSSTIFINDILKMEKFLYNLLNIKTDIVRFPGGSAVAYHKGVKSDIISKLRDKGYGYVDWTTYVGDADSSINGLDEMLEYCMHYLGDEKIATILMHDRVDATVELLPILIEELKNKGYTFAPLFYESIKILK